MKEVVILGVGMTRFGKLMDKSLKDIRSQLLTDIKSVLSDEQKSKFEAMIEKYRSQRKQEYEERKRRSEKSKSDKGEHR